MLEKQESAAFKKSILVIHSFIGSSRDLSLDIVIKERECTAIFSLDFSLDKILS
jgi:hypothetical protein